MKMKWTYTKVAEIAARYDTRSDFGKYAKGPYNWSLRHKCTDAVCAHMGPPFRWFLSNVTDEAQKYQTRNEFCKGSAGAYWWAKRNGKFDEVCTHMQPVLTTWDYDLVAAESLKYNAREEFRQSSKGAALWATRNNVFDEICSHMVHMNKPVTIKEARAAASLCATRSELYQVNPRVYAWALRVGVLDDICSHMTMGNFQSDADVVYLWKPEGYPDVFKIGVTSERLGRHRIDTVAKYGGLNVEWFIMKKTETALKDEKDLLALGNPFAFRTPFNGSTEFREYSPQDVDESLLLMRVA